MRDVEDVTWCDWKWGKEKRWDELLARHATSSPALYLTLIRSTIMDLKTKAERERERESPSSSCGEEGGVVTTPVNTGSRTLYQFGDKDRDSVHHKRALGEEMSPYFVGPMPVNQFLSEFLPRGSFKDMPSFTAETFENVVEKVEEKTYYKPFVGV
jgi:hypothetical protein